MFVFVIVMYHQFKLSKPTSEEEQVVIKQVFQNSSTQLHLNEMCWTKKMEVELN